MYDSHFWLGLNKYTFGSSSDCSGAGCNGKLTWLDGTLLDCSALGGCDNIFTTISRDSWSYFHKDDHQVNPHTGSKDVVCEATCTPIIRPPGECLRAPIVQYLAGRLRLSERL